MDMTLLRLYPFSKEHSGMFFSASGCSFNLPLALTNNGSTEFEDT